MVRILIGFCQKLSKEVITFTIYPVVYLRFGMDKIKLKMLIKQWKLCARKPAAFHWGIIFFLFSTDGVVVAIYFALIGMTIYRCFNIYPKESNDSVQFQNAS